MPKYVGMNVNVTGIHPEDVNLNLKNARECVRGNVTDLVTESGITIPGAGILADATLADVKKDRM